MDELLLDRLRGAAVGAAIGDAWGMPLEFGPRIASDRLVRSMQAGRLPAGSFTDDTEMALALAESLLAHRPLDPADLAQRFVAWLRAGPPDVGTHTRSVLRRVERSQAWEEAAAAVQSRNPDSAGNGSVMRCWPVALAHWNDPTALVSDSRLQSRVTHQHPECVASCAFINLAIFHLARGVDRGEAIRLACEQANPPDELRDAILSASEKGRDDLPSSGWVRHTIESAVWGLVTTDSFEEAVIQVVNLGGDADTAGAVVGALAGAACGLGKIPRDWGGALRGEWPLHSGSVWNEARLIDLADQLVATGDPKAVVA